MRLKKLFYYVIILMSVIFLLPYFAFPQTKQTIKDYEDEYFIYDIVEPKSMQTDCDFYIEGYKMNSGQKLSINKIDLKFFYAPQITLRYGIIKNLELQLYTGYTGVLTKGAVNIRILNNSLISSNKDLTGLSPLGFGIKAGLLSNKNLRPSIAVNGILTLPSVGLPAFRPDNPGAELYLNFYNQLGEKFDVAYDAGVMWSGFDSSPIEEYYMAISPGYYFSDNISLSINYTGYFDRQYSSENQYGLTFAYDVTDFFSFEIYAGSSINNRKYYFAGSAFSVLIPF